MPIRPSIQIPCGKPLQSSPPPPELLATSKFALKQLLIEPKTHVGSQLDEVRYTEVGALTESQKRAAARILRDAVPL